MADLSIEDIILSNPMARSRRIMSSLRPYLSLSYVEEAAQFILDQPGPVMIATGFYILPVQTAETDGPPGAIAIGRALQELGRPVYYVTDRVAIHLLRQEEERGAKVVDFPIVGVEESKKEAQRLLNEVKPSVLVAIERPGMTKSGLYRSFSGRDLTPWTARLDYLFLNHPATVAIGDGGNELGMGIFYEAMLKIPTLAPFPSITTCTHPIIATVSNWGGYGLVAALSRLTGRDLLPDEKEEGDLITWMALDQGAWGGVPGQAGVDGFPLEQNLGILRSLREAI